MQSVTLKIRRQGKSLVLTLPKAMAAAHGLGAGDRVHVTLTTAGVVVTPYDETFARAMEAADSVFSRYQNALKALADA